MVLSWYRTSGALESPGRLVKSQVIRLHAQNFWVQSIGLGWSQRICFCNKSPGDIDAACWEALIYRKINEKKKRYCLFSFLKERVYCFFGLNKQTNKKTFPSLNLKQLKNAFSTLDFFSSFSLSSLAICPWSFLPLTFSAHVCYRECQV